MYRHVKSVLDIQGVCFLESFLIIFKATFQPMPTGDALPELKAPLQTLATFG